MLKKSIILVITLLAVGLAVVAAQDLAAMDALMADFIAGRISPAEFERRMNELTSGIVVPQEQPRQQQGQQIGGIVTGNFPGATAGWPSASTLRRFGIPAEQPNIQTPHGVTYSHRIQGDKLTIYFFRNFIAGDPSSMAEGGYRYDDRRALENYFSRIFGGSNQMDDPTRPSVVPTPTNRGPFPYYYIRFVTSEHNTDTPVGGDMGILARYIVIEIEALQTTRSFVHIQ